MATQIASLDDDPQQNGDSGSDDDEMPSLQPSVPTAASASVPPPPPAPEEEEDEAPEGIIFPPLSLRPIIDKTASFVARSGAQFEERIRENERGNPKFSFLNPRDPYYAYYQYRIVQTKAGKGGAAALDPEAGEAKKEKKREKEAPKEPEKYEFVVEMPGISAQDLDVLLHTAQFTARNGRTFLTSLAQRESRNPQFDFLRPNHSLFPHFTRMVEQYTKVLLPSEALKKRLEENGDTGRVLERVMGRVEWKVWEEERRRRREEEDDAERLAFAEIDWHDFIVVETVEFTASDDLIPLPPPTQKSELLGMSLAQRNANLVVDIPDENEEDGEMEVEMDEDEAPAPAPQPAFVPQQMPGQYPGMMPFPGMRPPGFPPPGFPMPGMPIPGMPMPPGMGAVHPREDEEEAREEKKRKMEEDAISIGVETAKATDNKATEWSLDGRTFTLDDVYPSSTIAQVKEKIQARIKMPSNRQKLSTAAGVVMKNTATVASYGLKVGDKVLLDVRAK